MHPLFHSFVQRWRTIELYECQWYWKWHFSSFFFFPPVLKMILQRLDNHIFDSPLLLHLSVTRMRSFGGVTVRRWDIAPPGEVAIVSKEICSLFWCAFTLHLMDTLESLISSPVISKPSTVLHLSRICFMIFPIFFFNPTFTVVRDRLSMVWTKKWE